MALFCRNRIRRMSAEKPSSQIRVQTAVIKTAAPDPGYGPGADPTLETRHARPPRDRRPGMHVTESDIRATIASARVTDPRIAVQFDDKVDRGDIGALTNMISSLVRVFLGTTKNVDLETASRVARSYLP
ncbi:hypothetical protein Aph01nite_57080 [Acrocarpospora phusangensis]|uniref:Uncharacterized protein n=2 Tax=Acrocarpospora phusangensis TaxID=1070424 RepID=A0A919QES2_9ACTN|nr:hypothetical protein Aph01nite_57080 [Acrocarpospora phusangensis]